MKHYLLLIILLAGLAGFGAYKVSKTDSFKSLTNGKALVSFFNNSTSSQPVDVSPTSPYPECKTNEQIKILLNNIDVAKKEVSDLPKTVASLKKEVATAKTLFTRANTALVSGTKTFDTQRTKYSKLIQTQALTIRSIEDQIKKTTNSKTLSSLKSKLAAAIKTQGGYMSTLKTATSKYDTLRKNKTEAESKLNTLTTKLTKLTSPNVMVDLTKELADAKAIWSKFNGYPICAPVEDVNTQCKDGIDNDRDGKADCSDSDCANTKACLTPPTVDVDPKVDTDPNKDTPKLIYYEANCSDGQDNDGNGVTDCRDDACRGSDACSSTDDYCPVIPFGDNGDQVQPDCEDPDCRSTEASCQNNSTPTGPGSGNPGMGNRPAGPKPGSVCCACQYDRPSEGDAVDYKEECIKELETNGCNAGQFLVAESESKEVDANKSLAFMCTVRDPSIPLSYSYPIGDISLRIPIAESTKLFYKGHSDSYDTCQAGDTDYLLLSYKNIPKTNSTEIFSLNTGCSTYNSAGTALSAARAVINTIKDTNFQGTVTVVGNQTCSFQNDDYSFSGAPIVFHMCIDGGGTVEEEKNCPTQGSWCSVVEGESGDIDCKDVNGQPHTMSCQTEYYYEDGSTFGTWQYSS